MYYSKECTSEVKQVLNDEIYRIEEVPNDARDLLLSMGLTGPCSWEWSPKNFEQNYCGETGQSKHCA